MEHAALTNQALGQYRLLEELGRGGMGRVYKALHTIMGRVVAIKVIAPELMSDPVAVEWFRREVRASTHLIHPNIVMALDANEADGLHFLVMEYVEGITLDALVRQRGPLPVEHVCALMRQAALGLQHAHDKDMVHRDIKPGNLLIPHSANDQPSEVLVKILDFGLARLQGKTHGDTIALRGESGVLGTPDYISPEQSRDIHSADIRSDLYSLGCAFYFALAGRVPFPGENAMEKLVKHLMERAEPLENVRPDVPPAVAAIVRRLMAKDPAQRFQTPAELVHELDAWSAERPRQIPSTRTPTQSSWVASPTQMAGARPITSAQPEQPEHTCVLDRVEIFPPARRGPEPTGPSLFEELAPSRNEMRPVAPTHDTLTLSRAEETEEVTAEALATLSARPISPSADKTESDRTHHDNSAAHATRALPEGNPPPVDPVVARLWRRWATLVEQVVAGRGLSAEACEHYRTIHPLLLQACRAAIADAAFPECRAFYEEMLSVAQPWLKPQTFAQIESAMLESLLVRCRRIDCALNNGKIPWTGRQCLGFALLMLSPIALVIWYVSYGQMWLPALLRTIKGDVSLATLRSAGGVIQTHPFLLLGLIFPLAILFSFSLLSRSTRT